MKRCFGNSTLRLPQFILMLVTVKQIAPDRSCKLTPKFSGPYLLTAKFHSNKFKLLDPNTHISEVVQVDCLKRSALPSPLLLCLLLHLLIFLHLTLALLTVTDCSQLSVTDQFPLPPLFSLARSEANLASPCCISFYLFFLVAPLGTYPFLGAYAFIFFL